MSVTLESVLALAERRLGSRKAVFDAIAVSRQRFHSAMRGGPPLHIERLLRLALAAGADPLETLRAGGRSRFADLLEEAARPRLGDTTITQRALLREYQQLSTHTQGFDHVAGRRPRGRAPEPTGSAARMRGVVSATWRVPLTEASRNARPWKWQHASWRRTGTRD